MNANFSYEDEINYCCVVLGKIFRLQNRLESVNCVSFSFSSSSFCRIEKKKLMVLNGINNTETSEVISKKLT